MEKKANGENENEEYEPVESDSRLKSHETSSRESGDRNGDRNENSGDDEELQGK